MGKLRSQVMNCLRGFARPAKDLTTLEDAVLFERLMELDFGALLAVRRYEDCVFVPSGECAVGSDEHPLVAADELKDVIIIVRAHRVAWSEPSRTVVYPFRLEDRDVMLPQEQDETVGEAHVRQYYFLDAHVFRTPDFISRPLAAIHERNGHHPQQVSDCFVRHHDLLPVPRPLIERARVALAYSGS